MLYFCFSFCVLLLIFTYKLLKISASMSRYVHFGTCDAFAVSKTVLM